MIVNLIDVNGDNHKQIDIPDTDPTPLVIVDAETSIIYQLKSISNRYDYYPVNYFINGIKSNALINIKGEVVTGDVKALTGMY